MFINFEIEKTWRSQRQQEKVHKFEKVNWFWNISPIWKKFLDLEKVFRNFGEKFIKIQKRSSQICKKFVDIEYKFKVLKKSSSILKKNSSIFKSKLQI